MTRVIQGDCIEVIPQLVVEGGIVDAIVTDPPYGLEFMGVAWDTMRANGKPRIRNEWGDFGSREHPREPSQNGRVARKKSIALEEFTFAWACAAYDVLKPGGYLLAFGGTRTHHRIWSAIEDAGFVIQDTILWLYGSGFPKGRAQLKPAFELICVAYKPGGKRTLQVDECRIDAQQRDARGNHSSRPINSAAASSYDLGSGYAIGKTDLGRWPANVCHDGSDEVMEAFAAFGESKSSGRARINNVSLGSSAGGIYGKASGFIGVGYEDAGTPARYFYCAKASKIDRAGSMHPTVKPVALMRWLVRLVTPLGGTVLDPFAGSGTTGAAALAEGRNAILIEREPEYIADIHARLAFYDGSGAHSLTAKRRNRKAAEPTDIDCTLFGRPV